MKKKTFQERFNNNIKTLEKTPWIQKTNITLKIITPLLATITYITKHYTIAIILTIFTLLDIILSTIHIKKHNKNINKQLNTILQEKAQ